MGLHPGRYDSACAGRAGVVLGARLLRPFLPNAPLAIRAYRSNAWLEGEESAEVSDERLFAESGSLYARDYVAAWTEFLDDLALQRVSTSAQALQLMESLLANDSPLDALVRMVSEHTVLPLVRDPGTRRRTRPPQAPPPRSALPVCRLTCRKRQ